jgi:biotin carboxyl carrier protein
VKVEIVIDGRSARLEYTRLENKGPEHPRVEHMRVEHRGHFRYERENGGATSDGIEADYSVSALTPGAYSVLIGGRSYEVVAGAPGEIVVKGRTFAVTVFDPREMRGRKTKDTGEGRRNIAAMMPGKVVRILVAEGDAIEAGQGLIVVEAMKMQNEMKSPKAGRVVEVKVKADATVAAGEVLLVIE